VSKFGELPSKNLRVYAVKMQFFAAIRPYFDEDLQASRWRFQTDWKITILILAD